MDTNSYNSAGFVSNGQLMPNVMPASETSQLSQQKRHLTLGQSSKEQYNLGQMSSQSQ